MILSLVISFCLRNTDHEVPASLKLAGGHVLRRHGLCLHTTSHRSLSSFADIFGRKTQVQCIRSVAADSTQKLANFAGLRRCCIRPGMLPPMTQKGKPLQLRTSEGRASQTRKASILTVFLTLIGSKMKILLTLALLVTSLGGVAAGMSSEAMIDPNVSPLNYTDGGFLLQGFLAVPETANPLPAVVIIPDCKFAKRCCWWMMAPRSH